MTIVDKFVSGPYWYATTNEQNECLNSYFLDILDLQTNVSINHDGIC